MALLLRAVLAVAFAILVSQADAARIDVTAIAGGRQALTVSGPIIAGDDQRFESAIAAAPNPVVVLASPGGLVAPALAIGNRIRARAVNTVVPPGADCASACALIWLAGTTRILAETGRIGLHAIALRGSGGAVETHAFDAALRHYLTALGYSLDTTAVIVNTPASMVRWMDATELNAAGISTRSMR